MPLDEKATAFLEANRDAAMVTLRRNGTPHATRIALGLMDGRLLSSSTQTRVRTRNLRRDPRCTLFVFETSPQPGTPIGRYLTLETTVNILDGPDAPRQNLEYRRRLLGSGDGKLNYGGQLLTEEEFLEKMVADQRIMYEFQVTRAYGVY